MAVEYYGWVTAKQNKVLTVKCKSDKKKEVKVENKKVVA